MDEIAAYYELDREHDRLTRGLGVVEFGRTLELLGRVLPPAPAVVLDVGGGTGIYARELLNAGYTVHLLDAMPGHVARVQADPSLAALASVTLGDARTLPFAEASADAVLLMGPLYHLTRPGDRLAALAEARRVLRPGGRLVVTVIPRSAAICGDFTRGLPAEAYFRPIREAAYTCGEYLNPDHRAGYFTTAYFHHPDELEAELAAVGFGDVTLYALEGPAGLLRDPEEVMRDPERREGLFAALRLLECDRALLGISAHLLAVGQG
ncbi:class I SAM-dependent methyltransferase [Deinococcus metallilatus]|uniref:SAM-dependent methyltransferase n=1 Tax=Deinococcus metallilatus TaxID=1211322 RepID=A0AAJ5F4C4_9DEIO|nr:class I SAM-dependent methyltransferase [Deinococcus metallilatus]MBB5294575.1 SAM-dependent methyltransferase [Deinococcus metallilatus]QBY07618.1 class I SAM-dependent methyltransferase [Deinococcus metallilatus]RXJ14034.1 class I SAM-dependent methyltransferase [Deinococcus metallilatus]TLK29999.1 class I SAM-dependent methyltransferase [Deinococcus metallilatus]GMA15788.1 hypothetical protein GCM10025871_21190 [Deinococcus metallilatus]